MRILSLLFIVVGMGLAQAEISWRPTLHRGKRVAAADHTSEVPENTASCFNEIKRAWEAVGYPHLGFFMYSTTHFVRTDSEGVTTVYTKEGSVKINGVTCNISREKAGADALADELNDMTNSSFGDKIKSSNKAMNQLRLAMGDCGSIGGNVQNATYNIRAKFDLPVPKTREASSGTPTQF